MLTVPPSNSAALRISAAPAQEVDVAAGDLIAREGSEPVAELGHPDRHRLSADEDDLVIGDDLFETREDPFGLLQTEGRRCFVVGVRRRGLVRQERDFALDSLMRAREGGKANASVSRFICAMSLLPDRRSCASL